MTATTLEQYRELMRCVREVRQAQKVIEVQLQHLEEYILRLADLEKFRLQVVLKPSRQEQVETVIAITSAVFGVPVVVVMSRNRTERVAAARQAIYHILKAHLMLGVTEVGRFMSRDHGAVLSGLRACLDRMDVEPDYRRGVQKAVVESLEALKRGEQKP